jgi:hypothetical protein
LRVHARVREALSVNAGEHRASCDIGEVTVIFAARQWFFGNRSGIQSDATRLEREKETKI